MNFDKDSFTLHFVEYEDKPDVIDLVEPFGTVYYRKKRVPGSEYKVEVYDPASESLLVTVTASTSTSKIKYLELCNPTTVVELKHTGTISFRWSFKWEDHDFEWRCEECVMVRKPDPPILVATTEEPAGPQKTSSVQILDYNLNQLDIEDRKGFEIVLLTALLTFHDGAEASYTPRDDPPSPPSATLGGLSWEEVTRNITFPEAEAPPPPPPKPTPQAPVLQPPRPARRSEGQRMAKSQAEKNEITIKEDGSAWDYALECCKLLEDVSTTCITVLSAEPKQAPKLLQVVEEVNWIKHRAGLGHGAKLYQYLLYYDAEEKTKEPPRIVLDDTEADIGKLRYRPPNSLAIVLSKVAMPDLQPKPSISVTPPSVRHEAREEDRMAESSEGRRDDRDHPSQPPEAEDSNGSRPSPVESTNGANSASKKLLKSPHGPSSPHPGIRHSHHSSSEAGLSGSDTPPSLTFPVARLPYSLETLVYVPQAIYGPGAYEMPPPAPSAQKRPRRKSVISGLIHKIQSHRRQTPIPGPEA